MRTDYLSRLGDEVKGKVWDEFSDSRGQLIKKSRRWKKFGPIDQAPGDPSSVFARSRGEGCVYVKF